MRFLKNKIAKALKHCQSISPQENFSKQESEKSPEEESILALQNNNKELEEKEDSEMPEVKKTKEAKCQNIVKNYARAMINFSLDKIAAPYLTDILAKEPEIDFKRFRKYINQKREKVNCIQNLRSMLLVLERDTVKVAAYKRVFREICLVFLKYFSVNWVFESRVKNKIVFLRYRFKLLRRVQRPEHFTYLEDFH